ncbi:MAG: hypothetical protein ACLRMJ_03065 [Alistipes finegoldii]
MTRISTCDYWAYAYHVLYFSKSVGSTWGKKLDHFYYGRLTLRDARNGRFRDRRRGRHGQHLPHVETSDRLHRF